MGIGVVVDNKNILVGRRTLSESRACCLSGTTSQITDGAAAKVASTGRDSKEKCYRYTQTTASKVKEERGKSYVLVFFAV